MTKLSAIAHLDLALAHNKDFKKAWTDYIELAVIEAMEAATPPIDSATQAKIAKEASRMIIRLFDPIYWAAHDGKKFYDHEMLENTTQDLAQR